MGCNDSRNRMITLICYYETGNNEQKSYCNKLKENYKGNTHIRFEIKDIPQVHFGIKLRISDKTIDIQKVFDNREETMNEILEKIYKCIEENEKMKEKK